MPIPTDKVNGKGQNKLFHTDHSSIISVAGEEPIEAGRGPGQGRGRELTSEERSADPQ
jgi:hypothetical protein